MSEVIKRDMVITFNDIYHCTYSEVVLKYIQNESKRFKVYVGTRIAEIGEKSKVPQ